MSLYFDNIVDRGRLVLDPEGAEADDLADVSRAAVAAANSLITEAVKRGDHDYRGSMDVVDEQGKTVVSLAYDCGIQIRIIPPTVP